MSWVGIANSGEIFYTTGDNGLVTYGELRGDVSGVIDQTVVTALQGNALTITAPGSGDILQFNGTTWENTALTGLDMDTHSFLNGMRHTDTVAHTVVRGDIIVGNATPAWDALALGTDEFVLYSDGTDVLYTRLGQNTPFEDGLVGAPGVTFNSDHFTGAYLSSSGVMGLVAGTDELLTLDGGATRVTIDAGQVVQTRIGGTTTLTSADYVYLVNAVSTTTTLPPSPLTGQVHYIKDTTGSASNATPIVVAGNGNNIDGNATIEIRRNYGSFTLIYNGTEWNII